MRNSVGRGSGKAQNNSRPQQRALRALAPQANRPKASPARAPARRPPQRTRARANAVGAPVFMPGPKQPDGHVRTRQRTAVTRLPATHRAHPSTPQPATHSTGAGAARRGCDVGPIENTRARATWVARGDGAECIPYHRRGAGALRTRELGAMATAWERACRACQGCQGHTRRHPESPASVHAHWRGPR